MKFPNAEQAVYKLPHGTLYLLEGSVLVVLGAILFVMWQTVMVGLSVLARRGVAGQRHYRFDYNLLAARRARLLVVVAVGDSWHRGRIPATRHASEGRLFAYRFAGYFLHR